MVGGGAEERTEERQNTRSKMEVAKPPIFNREAEIVEGFISVCKLYLKNAGGVTVEEQVNNSLIFTGRINRCMKRKYTRGLRDGRKKI